jgi:heterodisulfide reductase subunit A-like polyferredoxin
MAEIFLRSNGVSSPDRSPNDVSLKVVIAGAGIAGLVAAVGLRDQGHQVHVWQSASRDSCKLLTSHV